MKPTILACLVLFPLSIALPGCPTLASEIGSPGLAVSNMHSTDRDTTAVTSESAAIFAETLALVQRLAEPERLTALGAIAIGYAEIH